QLGALQGLLVHADQTLREEHVRVRLLHRQRDQLALHLDVLQRDGGGFLRGGHRRVVLAEVEQELREGHAGDDRVAEVARGGRRGGAPPDRRQDHVLALRRRGRGRDLRQERRERLVHAETRGGVIAEPCQDLGLTFERDRQRFVERDHPTDDRAWRR